jgi:factor associated with neutral sphingomyelinase activation
MLLESKLGYLYTDFDSNSDVMPFSDHLFTKMALKSNSKVLVTTSANGSVNILVNAE